MRLRGLLPASITQQNSGFAQAVAAANQALDQIDLEIDITAGCVRINHKVIKLPPMQLGLFCLLAWRCQQHMPPLPAPLKEVDDPDWRATARQDLNQAMGAMHIPDSLARVPLTAIPRPGSHRSSGLKCRQLANTSLQRTCLYPQT